MTKHGRGVLGLLAVALMLAWPVGAAESVIKKHVEKGRTALMKKDLQGAGSALCRLAKRKRGSRKGS